MRSGVSKRTERTESVFGVQIHQKKCEGNKKTKLLVKDIGIELKYAELDVNKIRRKMAELL